MRQEYENIYITKDAPLVIRREGDTMRYGTVYMETGAYIEICAGRKFFIEDLLPADSVSRSARKNCVAYPTLSEGEKPRESERYDIIITTLSGADGERGNDGGAGGGEGQRGTCGSPADVQTREQFFLEVENLGKDIRVLSIGGSGGNGGNGGCGGDGWNGTSESDPGTAGGNGGNGGNGGDASDAVKNLYICWESENGCTASVDCRAAKGGNAGTGGDPGRNGAFYSGRKAAERGKDGQAGADGKKGTWQRVCRMKRENGTDIPARALYERFCGQKGQGTFRLDFADPEQAEAFLESLGGKEYLETYYPRLYEAYQKTVRHAVENRYSTILPDRTIPNTFSVTAINSERDVTAGQGAGAGEEDGIALEVFNYTRIHDAEAQFSFVTGEIINVTDNILLESTAYTSSDRDAEFRLSTNPLDYLGMDGKEFQEVSCRSFVTGSGLLGVEAVSTQAVLIDGLNSVVKKITIEEPKSQTGNNPLIYLYNRTPFSGEAADKTYPESEVQYDKRDNTVNTLLGIRGTIEFNKDAGVTGICGFAQWSDTNNRRLLVNGTGAAEFGYHPEEIAGFFSPQASEQAPSKDLKVSFKFPENWNCRLDKNVYENGANSVVADLLFSFYYKILIKDAKTGKEKILTMPVTIKSQSDLDETRYYISENSTTVCIPPIKIRWGCFAAETMIEMENHQTKEIRRIRKGDMVMTPDGGKPVLEVYYGTEKSLVCIETEKGRSIRVTKDHPMLTRRGVLRAGRLKSSDEICMAGGRFERIGNVYEADYAEEQEVYNIEVDGGLIYANGFLAGEFGTQNDLSEAEKNRVFAEYGVRAGEEQEKGAFTEEARETVREFAALLEERCSVAVTLPEIFDGK